MPADPESAAWVAALVAGGAERDRAVARLHELLLRVARGEVRRRADRVGLAGAEADDLAVQAADDAVLAVTRKVRDFRGESRFTTWAYKFAVFEVSAKVGAHVARRRTVALDADDWARLPDRFGFTPAEVTEGRDLLAALRQAVERDLTAHQRRVFVALVLDGVPVDGLAAELGTTRGALYKTMYDARRSLRRRLTDGGYLDDLSRHR